MNDSDLRQKLLGAAVVSALVACCLLPSPVVAQVEPLPFIRAVHYFGAEWPKTFWEAAERGRVAGDFEQIVQDGFNTVIFVVPWRGFQQQLNPPVYDKARFRQLEFFIEEARKAGLLFVLRVSYPHNFDPLSKWSSHQRCEGVFTERNTKRAWRDYLVEINKRVVDQPHYAFSFFSWEDLFCALDTFPLRSAEDRILLARQVGFQKWLAERHSLPEIRVWYGRPIVHWNQVPIPSPNTVPYFYYLKFVNEEMWGGLLEAGRRVMPSLSMEIRVDSEPLRLEDAVLWLPNDVQTDDPQVRASYWVPYFGSPEVQELTAAETLHSLEFMLEVATDSGENTNHVLAQFNFVDDSPGFRGIRIVPEELQTFFDGAAPLLLENTRGYGFWTYHDYRSDLLYNSSFERDLEGWTVTGAPRVVVDHGGDRGLVLAEGESIAQTLEGLDRQYGLLNAPEIEFCVRFSVTTETFLRVETGGPSTTLALNPAESNHCQRVPNGWTAGATNLPIVISSEQGEARLDGLSLFLHVQKMGIYEADGTPGAVVPMIRRLNGMLQEAAPVSAAATRPPDSPSPEAESEATLETDPESDSEPETGPESGPESEPEPER